VTAHHLPIKDDDKPCQQPSAPNSVINQVFERLMTLSPQLESAVVVKLVAGTAPCYAEYDLCSGTEGYVPGDARANPTGARANSIIVTSRHPSFYAPNSLGIQYARSFIHACTFVPFTTFLLTSHLPLTTRLAHAEVN
jgi:hypothetical protein